MTYNYLEVSQEYFKLRIFPLELKDKAKEWFRSVGQGFTSWSEMEKYFFKNFILLVKQTPLGEKLVSLPMVEIILLRLGRGLWP